MLASWSSCGANQPPHNRERAKEQPAHGRLPGLPATPTENARDGRDAEMVKSPPSLGGADDLAQRTQPEGAPLTLWPQALASPLRASSPAVKGGSSPPGNPWPKKTPPRSRWQKYPGRRRWSELSQAKKATGRPTLDSGKSKTGRPALPW